MSIIWKQTSCEAKLWTWWAGDGVDAVIKALLGKFSKIMVDQKCVGHIADRFFHATFFFGRFPYKGGERRCFVCGILELLCLDKGKREEERNSDNPKQICKRHLLVSQQLEWHLTMLEGLYKRVKTNRWEGPHVRRKISICLDTVLNHSQVEQGKQKSFVWRMKTNGTAIGLISPPTHVQSN